MRRILGIAASIGLLAAGTLLLVGYVRGAEERALEGEEVVGVLVADRQIDAGTAAAEIGDAVRIEKVPLKVRVDGAVSDLSQVENLVAAADLLPGEQLAAARFAEPEDLMEHRAVAAPPGTVRVTVSLSPERAVGGQLIPGDTVGVIASFDPFDVVSAEPGEVIGGEEEGEPVYVGSTPEGEQGLRTPNSSHLILHGILVTNVQVEQLPTPPNEDSPASDAPDLAPTGNLLVTMAVLPSEAEKVVFTAEHGFLWLVADDEDSLVEGTSIQTRETVYR